MKITSAWWADKKARLPLEPEAFDYGDTALAILELSGIPNAEEQFRAAIGQLVPDATLHNSALNNLGYGLLAVRADVRKVIVDALFAVKDPAVLLETSSQQPSPVVPSTSAALEKIMGDVDRAAERIIAQSPPGMRTSSGRLISSPQGSSYELNDTYLCLTLSGILALFDVQQIAKELLALGAEETSAAILPAFWHRPLKELLADAPRTFDVVVMLLRSKGLTPEPSPKSPVTDTPTLAGPRESRGLIGDTHVVGVDRPGAIRAADVAAFAAAEAAKRDLPPPPPATETHESLAAKSAAAHAEAEAAHRRMNEVLGKSTTKLKADQATTGLPPDELKNLSFE